MKRDTLNISNEADDKRLHDEVIHDAKVFMDQILNKLADKPVRQETPSWSLVPSPVLGCVIIIAAAMHATLLGAAIQYAIINGVSQLLDYDHPVYVAHQPCGSYLKYARQLWGRKTVKRR